MTKNSPSSIWYTRCPVPTPLGIAVQLGWVAEAFGRDGIAVESVFDHKDPAVRKSHFDHHLAYSFRQGGNIPAIWARSRGAKSRLIGITWTDEFQAIITLPERGIAKTEDLAGRRFGLTRNDGEFVDINRAIALKGLTSALSLVGLEPEAVDLVDLPIGSYFGADPDPALFGLRRAHAYRTEIRALVDGKVDAIYVKGAEGLAAANLIGARSVVEFGFHPDPKIRINSGTPRTLTVDETFLDERPDLVARLVAEVQRAGRWAAAHPEETRRIVATEIGVSEDAVVAAHGPALARSLSLGLDANLVAAIDHYKTFLFTAGFLPADFALAEWISEEPLQAAELVAAA
ncbi:MAG: ABC transporter substrate-binding protein [Bauldia sp.]|nr:ABC transporter substrate-binding protein [Bauldia sp.]